MADENDGTLRYKPKCYFSGVPYGYLDYLKTDLVVFTPFLVNCS